jgi:hypothetical protein
MPKAKHAPTFKQVARRNLFILAIVLITLGLLSYFVQERSKKMAEVQNIEQTAKETSPKAPGTIGPNNGCTEDNGNYVCDVKITNPSETVLEWSAQLEDIEGASVTPENYGTIAANNSTVVQLVVPQVFCTEKPEGKGTITIMDDKKSSDQLKAKFACEQE